MESRTLAIFRKTVLLVQLGAKKRRADKKIHPARYAPAFHCLIDFAGQSIALANFKITPQLNTFRANRDIVMQGVDDFSPGFLAGPKDRIRKSPYIIDMNNFR